MSEPEDATVTITVDTRRIERSFRRLDRSLARMARNFAAASAAHRVLDHALATRDASTPDTSKPYFLDTLQEVNRASTPR